MSQVTSIEWTDISWNPVHGCSKVSPGCAHCYAETLSRRYKQTLSAWTPANAASNVLLKPHKLREPLSQTKDWRGLGAAAAAAGKTDGKLVFVNSTSDLFHEQVPDEFIAQVFSVMAAAPQHTFQILTKRPERMREVVRGLAWQMPGDGTRGRAEVYVPSYGIPASPLPNVWLGVSIENRRYVGRAGLLRETPAAVRFISAEPLLGPLVYDGSGDDTAGEDRPWWQEDGYLCWADDFEGPQLDLAGIDQVICGGESGQHLSKARHRHRFLVNVNGEARADRIGWVRDLRDACKASETAFFFKQWGGRTPKAGGRELDGRAWSEFPEAEAIAA